MLHCRFVISFFHKRYMSPVELTYQIPMLLLFVNVLFYYYLLGPWLKCLSLFQMYEFPECDSDEDEEFKQQDRELKASVPFAVVGSNTILEIAGKKIRGRQYPWGVVDGVLYK